MLSGAMSKCFSYFIQLFPILVVPKVINPLFYIGLENLLTAGIFKEALPSFENFPLFFLALNI